MSQPPAVTLDGASPVYHTIDGAANAVSGPFAAQQQNEQAAVIIRRPDGSYAYSTVAPQTDHDKFALRALLQKGYTMAGIVHSHPGTDAMGQVFSPQDLGTADQMKVPSFVRFSDGSIRKYVPGVTHTQPYQVSGNRFGIKSAQGDQIDMGADNPPPGALAAAAPPDSQPGALVAAQQ